MTEPELLRGARSMPPLAPAGTGAGALHRVLTCVGRLYWLKPVGITAFMCLFFVAYFHLLRHPVQAAIEMPLTAIDRWIPFQAWALWPYVSLWFYVVIPPSLFTSARSLAAYGVWIGSLCLVGLACFYFWPSTVPRSVLSTEGMTGFDLLHGVDAAGNACPSLHVAAAAFSAAWIDRLVRTLGLPTWLRGFNALWFVLIVWSTMATRQHVWWDVLAGLGLALLFTPPSLRWVGAPRWDDIIAPQGIRAGGGQ